MANKDLKDVDAVNLAQITPHGLGVVSESRPVDESIIPKNNCSWNLFRK